MLPKSKMGEAIKYSLNQWDSLIVFLENGRLSSDNNLSERYIKPFVLTRNNFLFTKSPKGATASGVGFSIVATATPTANVLNPFLYLNFLFETLPTINLENFDNVDTCLLCAKTLLQELKRKIEKR